METQQVQKVKRKYNKKDYSSSVLMNIIKEKGLPLEEISKTLDVGKGTMKKYLLKPLSMNGHQRLKVASFIGVTANELSDLIDK